MSAFQLNQAARGEFNILNPVHNSAMLQGSDTTLEEGVDKFRLTLLQSIWMRLEPRKPQFASKPWMLAIALDPYFKKYIYDDDYVFPHERDIHSFIDSRGQKLKLLTREQVEDVKMKLRDMEASAVHAFDETQANETVSPSKSYSSTGPSSKRRKTGRASIEENPFFALPEIRLSIRTGEHLRWARESLSHEPAIEFWHNQYNLRKSKPFYLYLPLVALAVLGIPRSSAECERDFSILGLLLSKLRIKMAPETIKRKIFLALNTQSRIGKFCTDEGVDNTAI